MIIIAEIGTSHSGSLQKAFSMIDEACEAGADAVKFQWVYAREILHPDTGFVNLPGGKTPLYNRFKELECPLDFYKECLEYAHKKNMLFMCSPFGLDSLKELASLKPDAIKIASPEVNHTPLLEECSKYYGTIPIILSSGVSKLSDLEKAINIITKGKTAADINGIPPLTLLHCITFYPAPEEEYNISCIKNLSNIFGIPAGLSDHSLDPVLVPCLSTAMGGTMIEKHITLSRKTDGLDDPVALEGEQFAQMVYAVHQTLAVIKRYKNESDVSSNFYSNENITPQALNHIYNQLSQQYSMERIKKVLGNGVKKLAESEINNYGRTNRSLHYMKDLKKGEIITKENVSVLRTEKVLSVGISPDFLNLIQNAVLTKDVKNGDGVQLEDFISFKK